MTKPIAVDHDDGDDRRPQRGETRDSMFLHAHVRPAAGGSSIQVRVRNLSSGGMMAEPDVHVAQGGRVVVELRGIGEIEATVAWTMVGRAGLAFDQEIDPRLARKTVADPGKGNRPVPVPQSRRPGFKVL